MRQGRQTEAVKPADAVVRFIGPLVTGVILCHPCQVERWSAAAREAQPKTTEEIEVSTAIVTDFIPYRVDSLSQI